MLNLTPEEASSICMDQCRAMCCRGPLILRLEPDEVAVFHREAVHLGTTADISPAADGGGNLLFLDHPGECCPMLDQATFACRIYEQRPRVCREFPRRAGAGLRHFRLDGRLNWYQGGIYICRATRVGMGLAQQSFGAGLEHSPAALFDLCLLG